MDFSDLQPVESSMLAAVGYGADKKTLIAEFLDSGDVWAYGDVPKSVFQALLKADSKGRFMRENILDCYSEWPLRKGRKRRRW